MKKLIALLVILLMVPSLSWAGTVTRPAKSFGGTSFINGVIPQASDFNGDHDTLYAEFNGNITNANISASAAIAASKLDLSGGFSLDIRINNAAPCFIVDESDQGADLRRWHYCSSGGELRFSTFTDAGVLVNNMMTINRAGSLMTLFAGMAIDGGEGSAPAAPSANRGRYYFVDDGAGNTELAVRFETGDPIVLATQNAGGPRIVLSTQSGTSYTLVLSDAGDMVEMNNASAITLTVPANATTAFAIGTHIMIRQMGAGQITITPAGSVTFQSLNSVTKTAGQYAVASLIKTATNTWSLSGNLVAP